jgi:hypothetical protein
MNELCHGPGFSVIYPWKVPPKKAGRFSYGIKANRSFLPSPEMIFIFY